MYSIIIDVIKPIRKTLQLFTFDQGSKWVTEKLSNIPMSRSQITKPGLQLRMPASGLWALSQNPESQEGGTHGGALRRYALFREICWTDWRYRDGWGGAVAISRWSSWDYHLGHLLASAFCQPRSYRSAFRMCRQQPGIFKGLKPNPPSSVPGCWSDTE